MTGGPRSGQPRATETFHGGATFLSGFLPKDERTACDGEHLSDRMSMQCTACKDTEMQLLVTRMEEATELGTALREPVNVNTRGRAMRTGSRGEKWLGPCWESWAGLCLELDRTLTSRSWTVQSMGHAYQPLNPVLQILPVGGTCPPSPSPLQQKVLVQKTRSALSCVAFLLSNN
jgi:hypothetical protein